MAERVRRDAGPPPKQANTSLGREPARATTNRSVAKGTASDLAPGGVGSWPVRGSGAETVPMGRSSARAGQPRQPAGPYAGRPGGQVAPVTEPVVNPGARVVPGPALGPGRPAKPPPASPKRAASASYPRARRATAAVPDVRRRRVVRRIDVWAAFKLSLAFYLCGLVVMLVAGTVLWNVAAAFGVIHNLDKLVRSLFALSSFKLRPLSTLAWGSAVGLVLCLIGTFLNVLATVLYNLISDVVGGLQVFVVGDEEPGGR
jgi:hypothetical protein